MTHSFKAAIPACVMVLGLMAWSPFSAAADYPNRPIRVVVGFSAGGATDLSARIVALKLSERLGQSVQVDNRPGAGAIIASQVVAAAPPDGYTLLWVSPSQAINPSLHKTLPYNTEKDFAPIALACSSINVFVVRDSLPVKSVNDFIALAKKSPGKITFASGGIGSSGHLAGELFKSMAGIDIVHVPYRGTGEALRDVVSGRVDSGFNSLAEFLPFIRNGSVRAIAVGSKVRIPQLPDLPTVDQSGLPGYDVSTWMGMLAPAKTPPAIIEKLNHEINAVMQDPDVQKQMTQLAIIPLGKSTPAAFGAWIKSEIAKYAKIIQSAGIQPT
jgi:tripartite-type tricarboxylate transporter receptor subunit TctC